MVTRGLSERRALTVVHMSAAALRYVPRPDPDPSLRDRIVALAHRHRRYGAGMIYLKLRQEGRVVNHKRVDRLYAEARLQVRRRRRKKVPLADRQPLARPQAPNEVWSADFVFDRTAEGRVLKCLTIVDDATTEAVAVVPARALGGLPVTRVLDALAITRGLPQVLRTDNGKEFKGAFAAGCERLGIRVTRTKPRHAWTNGFVERLQKTILHEHWRIAFRRQYFTGRRSLQGALDRFLQFYNHERTHRGYRLNGRTPASVFRGAVAA